MSDPPLLSQDEFFRHLNLQSIHFDSGQGGTGGRYMYRQALKERLRASSYAKTNYYKTTTNSTKAEAKKTHSPQVSPCKWMTDSQQKKIFGRPKVRKELFKNEEKDPKKTLMSPLMDNCHVLRHPGIKKELESFPNKNKTDLVRKVEYLPQARTPTLPLPTESLQVRAVQGSPLPLHCICERPQPGREARDAHLAQEAVRKAATRALFGHGESNVKLTSLGPSSVTKVKPKALPVNKPATTAPITSHKVTTTKTGLTLTCDICNKTYSKRSHLLRHINNAHPHAMLNAHKVKVIPTRSSSTSSSSVAKKKPFTAVKLLSERSPLRNNNCPEHAKKLLRENNCHNIKHADRVSSGVTVVPQCKQCKQCGRKYKTSHCPLKSWKEAVQSSSLCETCRTVNQLRHESKELVNSLVLPPPPPDYDKTCDICNKTFLERSHMIRHMTSVHALNIHKVDLAKFANFKTPRPPPTAPVATVRHSSSAWMEPSPTKQPHLKQFISA